MQKETTLTDMPNIILNKIMSYLEDKDLLKISGANKRLLNLTGRIGFFFLPVEFFFYTSNRKLDRKKSIDSIHQIQDDVQQKRDYRISISRVEEESERH